MPEEGVTFSLGFRRYEDLYTADYGNWSVHKKGQTYAKETWRRQTHEVRRLHITEKN